MKNCHKKMEAYTLIGAALSPLGTLQLDPEITFEEKLEGCIETYRQVRHHHRAAFDLVFSELTLLDREKERDEVEQAFFDQVVNPWFLMIEMALGRGEIRDNPPELLVTYLLTFLQGLISLSDTQRRQWAEAGEIKALIFGGFEKK